LLNAILREETDLMKMYEQALTECDSVDVKSFVQEAMVAKSRTILSILQKLNELRARGEVGDGVMASFQ
jgi:hypothetical protein